MYATCKKQGWFFNPHLSLNHPPWQSNNWGSIGPVLCQVCLSLVSLQSRAQDMRCEGAETRERAGTASIGVCREGASACNWLHLGFPRLSMECLSGIKFPPGVAGGAFISVLSSLIHPECPWGWSTPPHFQSMRRCCPQCNESKLTGSHFSQVGDQDEGKRVWVRAPKVSTTRSLGSNSPWTQIYLWDKTVNSLLLWGPWEKHNLSSSPNDN